MTTLTFHLGTHHPSWLRKPSMPPLFVSHRALSRAGRRLPVAQGPWALDSGGFTELSMFGSWRTTPGQYVAAVRRYRDEIGHLMWAAPMDMMCEPFILAKTGLTVGEHQRRTVENLLELRARDVSLPWIPVVQGFTLDDYRRCVAMYDAAGVDLTTERLVGIGSVCRRQASAEIAGIVRELAGAGLRLHGFGVKTSGLAQYGPFLASADSLAWSYRGRRTPGCTPTHKNEANCLEFALAWRERALAGLPASRQLTVGDTARTA